MSERKPDEADEQPTPELEASDSAARDLAPADLTPTDAASADPDDTAATALAYLEGGLYEVETDPSSVPSSIEDPPSEVPEEELEESGEPVEPDEPEEPAPAAYLEELRRVTQGLQSRDPDGEGGAGAVGGEGDRDRVEESREEMGNVAAERPSDAPEASPFETAAASEAEVAPEAAAPQSAPASTPGASVVRRTRPREVVRERSSEGLEELFDQPGVAKLGIVGGKGVGKSYFFQSMIHRVVAGHAAGALTPFLDQKRILLFSALERGDEVRAEKIIELNESYRKWHRLDTTLDATQRWYRLRLFYRTGLVGESRSSLDVEFFDASGEQFFEASLAGENRKLWKDGYLDARVMVFCFPLWAAFPGPSMTEDDWGLRDQLLKGFERVLSNFQRLRDLHRRTHPVLSILALTMADDRRCALKTLQDRWILPYMEPEGSRRLLQALGRGPGIARYLDNARKVSDALHREIRSAPDPLVSSIPSALDFEGGPPWLIPVSAIDGAHLELVENGRQETTGLPIPVHVELPLLVALCERTNALM